MSATIDFNCDLGEDESAEGCLRERAILPHISSINVACGMHAGSEQTMLRTMREAAAHGIAIGAHPSLDDREGFGRRELLVTGDEAYALVLYQLGAAAAVALAAGVRLNHIKPHGALYNMAARDAALAGALARAVRDFDPGLVLYALAGSALARAGEASGLRIANEAFADRSYQADGSLTPRSRTDALIHDTNVAAAQVAGLVRDKVVRATDGTRVAVSADTICIHGDVPQAPAFAMRLRAELEKLGISVRPILRLD